MEKIKGQRESNIELLRIVAMFLVLIVHADFYALGVPSSNDIRANLLDSSLRIFFQSLSIACVDIFVFISGWFGIKPKVKGLSGFIFQCVFFGVGIYALALIIGKTTLSLEGIRGCFAATSQNWFIKAYLLLYILSPILNAFVENTSRKQYKACLIAFYLFQFIYGWIFSSSTAFISNGYSTISFIGLYLLAKYLHTYKPNFTNFKLTTDLFIVIGIVLGVTILYLLSPKIGNTVLNYISPTTLLMTIYTVLFFSKTRINCKFVNWCAGSSFAVYLLHANPNFICHYETVCEKLHNLLSPLGYWGGVVCLILVIYILALLLDQLRIYIWNIICECIALTK
jgi:surface polysaccharide O-acyltransferase-like enzyme